MGLKNLVIVESPAKAKTIAKYLNASKNLRHLGKFSVMASMGHIRDLKLRELSVDVNNDFATEYEVLKDKTKLVQELKDKVAIVNNVYLAADYDREGEAICEHLKHVLGLSKYYRITFTEITPKALEKAILSPREIDQNLVDAQETRRILDRLVGFKISPLLWKTYNANKIHLSAGRVQSAALHLIHEKEKEVQKFQSVAYWYFLGNFGLKIADEKHDLVDVKLHGDGDKVYKVDEDIAEARKLLQHIRNDFTIHDLKHRQMRQNPDLPFITSTLQQDAYSKLGFPLKRTNKLAQDLYEKGYITYMRTDSYNISDDFKQTVGSFITSKFGEIYHESVPQKKSKTNKNAQEAHEAIRPTNVQTTVIDELGFTADHKKLYDMIWKRTIGYFMKAAIFDELELRIHDSGIKPLYFQASFKKVKFNGYLILYGINNDDYNFDKYITAIKNRDYQVKCQDVTARNTWTSPPARYTEASIVKTLEAESIGRPSTFATILTKLFEKHYVLKGDVRGIDKNVVHLKLIPNANLHDIKEEKDVITVGHERSRLIPSDIGITIDDFMCNNFDYIIDKRFTATMEDDLDKIAVGQVSKLHMLKNFWKVFGADVEKIESVKKAEKVEKQKLNNKEIVFTHNNKEYIVRLAKYGPVIQYQQGDTTKYIDIRMYLKYVGKSYTNVSQEDITFLTALPKKVARVNGHDLMLTLGPYGLYFKLGEENVKIPLKIVKKIVEGQFSNAVAISADEIQSIVEFHLNKKKEKQIAKEEVKKDKKDRKVKLTKNTPNQKRTKP